MKGLTLPVRICLRSGVVAAAAVAALATTSLAQDSTAMRTAAPSGAVDQAGFRSHTVRAGETLWDIAHTYLGDGDLWPEIIRANRGLVRDPHWIFPNEVLRIPPAPAGVPADTGGALASATPAAQPAPAPAIAPAPSAPTPPAEPTAPDTVSVPAAADEAAPSAAGSTLFNRPPQSAALFAAARGSSLATRRREGVNTGEHNAAPYVDRDGGPRHAGLVVGVVDVSNVIVAAEVAHYSLDQEIYITMPKGSQPEVGARFYTYALGESFGDRGQVVEPTGIVSVIRPGSDKVATIARITQLFGEVQLNQGVLPLDQASLPAGPAAPLAGGAQSRVIWVEHNQVLPTIGFYVLLDASTKAGVRVGDQFTLYRAPVPNLTETVTLPESDVAIAKVVRVTQYGSSAIVIAQDQPAITPGIAARVTARINTAQ